MKKAVFSGDLFTLAEREGFEPSIGKIPITDFESAAFDHSAISPTWLYSNEFCEKIQ